MIFADCRPAHVDIRAASRVIHQESCRMEDVLAEAEVTVAVRLARRTAPRRQPRAWIERSSSGCARTERTREA